MPNGWCLGAIPLHVKSSLTLPRKKKTSEAWFTESHKGEKEIFHVCTIVKSSSTRMKTHISCRTANELARPSLLQVLISNEIVRIAVSFAANFVQNRNDGWELVQQITACLCAKHIFIVTFIHFGYQRHFFQSNEIPINEILWYLSNKVSEP